MYRADDIIAIYCVNRQIVMKLVKILLSNLGLKDEQLGVN